MLFGEVIKVALSAIRANKLRSLLTMLGIVIGVAAVIGLMSIGRGVQSQITSTFEELGSNAIFVIPYTPGVAPGVSSTPRLSVDDAEAVEDTVGSDA